MNRKTLEKARKIKLIAMDVDGVLTPGDIVIMESGEEVKSWNAKDRLGIFAARKAGGMKFAWVSGRKSGQVEERAKELKIEYVHLGSLKKLPAFDDMLKKFKLKKNEIAYIGDDLVDLPLLMRAGLSACPGDAVEEVRGLVDYITTAAGGRGVLREVIEVVLKAQGKWKKVVEKYMLG